MQRPASGKWDPLEAMQARDRLAGAQLCGKDLAAIRKKATWTGVNMSQQNFLAVEKVITIWGCIHHSRTKVMGKVIPLYMMLLSPCLGTACTLGLNLKENLSIICWKNADRLQRTSKITGVWSTWPVSSSRGNWGCLAGKEVAWEGSGSSLTAEEEIEQEAGLTCGVFSVGDP